MLTKEIVLLNCWLKNRERTDQEQEQEVNSLGNSHVPLDPILRTKCSHLIQVGDTLLSLAPYYMVQHTDGLTV